jgi:hypothetical protein
LLILFFIATDKTIRHRYPDDRSRRLLYLERLRPRALPGSHRVVSVQSADILDQRHRLFRFVDHHRSARPGANQLGSRFAVPSIWHTCAEHENHQPVIPLDR